MMVECSGSQGCILTLTILTQTFNYIMKKNTKLTGQGRQARRIAEMEADITRTKKHTWYLELMIAACLGASLALGFVVVHGMLTTDWTW
jgi:hypothetical protein